MKNICFFCLVLLLGACSSEDAFEPVYDVPEEFQPIVETFLAEASVRGYEFEINNLIIAYDDELVVKDQAAKEGNAKGHDDEGHQQPYEGAARHLLATCRSWVCLHEYWGGQRLVGGRPVPLRSGFCGLAGK